MTNKRKALFGILFGSLWLMMVIPFVAIGLLMYRFLLGDAAYTAGYVTAGIISVVIGGSFAWRRLMR